ncbi:hypothetical protein ACEQ8H_007820 [Pleosporales sp. CAS-2024a]
MVANGVSFLPISLQRQQYNFTMASHTLAAIKTPTSNPLIRPADSSPPNHTQKKLQNTPFSVSYGTGSVSGTLASDILHIGSFTPVVTFGIATTVSTEFGSYPMDGILGIGRGVKVDGSSIDASQLIDVLYSNKAIGTKMFGLHLSRAQDGVNDGELNIGEVNPNRFIGNLNYINAVENDSGFWEIPIDSAGVDGKDVGLRGRSAIIDTGTSFILMPGSDALSIHSQIPGFQQNGETFSVPCDTAAIIHFTFNKQDYKISTTDWRGGKLDSGLCRSNIIGRQAFKENQWLVGDVFLKNVYSVFDVDGRRIGLGVQSAQSATSSISTDGSTTSTGVYQTTAAIASAAAIPTTAADGESHGQGQSDFHKGQASSSSLASLAVVLLVVHLMVLSI